MRDRPCEYEGCKVETTSVTVNYHGREHLYFCGACHAALWLISREGHHDVAAELEQAFKEGP